MENNDFRKIKAKIKSKTKFAKKFRTVFFSRFAVVVILILLQLIFFALTFLKLQEYTIYLFRGTILISVFFLLYIVNTNDKNEFKIAWILPVLIIPIFGITFYFFFKYNKGGINLNKKILSIKKYSSEFLPTEKKVREIYDDFPEVKDLASYLNRYGKYPSFKDTKTEYFSCGELFFEDVLKELEKAKKFVFIEFFIVEPCQIMDRMLEILSRKVEEGVEVRILFDGIGSIALSSSMLKDYFTSFGINSKVWLKMIPVINTGFNNRDHRKIISIDGKIAYTGGINITDEYANIVSKRFDYWKDAGIKIEGPAVHTFTMMFLEQWNVQNKKNQPCEDFSKFISKKVLLEKKSKNRINSLVIPYGDDAYNNEEIGENVYKYILSHAEEKVYIMTPYIIIDQGMIDELIFAAKRGIKVEIIVPQKYDHFVSFCVGRNCIKTLIKNGIKVYAYQSGFIHSKTFSADNKMGTVGSINLDYRSFYHHFECGVFMYKSESIKDVEKDFEKTKLQCSEITFAEYKKIPIHIRLIGWLFRIIAPLM